jgi:hypothetical protein
VAAAREMTVPEPRQEDFFQVLATEVARIERMKQISAEES